MRMYRSIMAGCVTAALAIGCCGCASETASAPESDSAPAASSAASGGDESAAAVAAEEGDESAAAQASASGESGEDSSLGDAPTTPDEAYVEVSWLKDHADEVVVLDARSAADFMTQHIPGAVNLHWTDVSNVVEVQQGEPGWAELPDAKTLAGSISRLGIDNTKPVVVYTDTTDGWGEDGRMYWTLREAGVTDVRLLSGGWTQWLYQQGGHASGLDGVDQDAIAQVDTAFVKENADTAVIIDARAPEEFVGETTMGEVRVGRIPGAISVPYVDLVNEDGTMKTADELDQLLADAQVAKDDQVIVYCTGGVRAAAVAEALVGAGYTDVSVYTAGYSEWAGDPANEVEVG